MSVVDGSRLIVDRPLVSWTYVARRRDERALTDAFTRDCTHAVPFLVIGDADARISALRSAGIETIASYGAKAAALKAANLGAAKRIIVAIPNAFEVGQIVA